MSIDDDYDIIKKPRTQFSSNVLRRAIPKLNTQEKINTISMNSLNVLSQMRLHAPKEGNSKVLSVNNLPKIQSMDSKAMNTAMMGDVFMKPANRESNAKALYHIKEAEG